MNIFMQQSSSQYCLSLFHSPLEQGTFNYLHLMRLTADTTGFDHKKKVSFSPFQLMPGLQPYFPIAEWSGRKGFFNLFSVTL